MDISELWRNWFLDSSRERNPCVTRRLPIYLIWLGVGTKFNLITFHHPKNNISLLFNINTSCILRNDWQMLQMDLHLYRPFAVPEYPKAIYSQQQWKEWTVRNLHLIATPTKLWLFVFTLDIRSDHSFTEVIHCQVASIGVPLLMFLHCCIFSYPFDLFFFNVCCFPTLQHLYLKITQLAAEWS